MFQLETFPSVHVQANDEYYVTAAQGLAFFITSDITATQGRDAGAYFGWNDLSSPNNSKSLDDLEFSVVLEYYEYDPPPPLDTVITNSFGVLTVMNVSVRTRSNIVWIPPFTLPNLTILTVWIDYDGSEETLEFYLTDSQDVKPRFPRDTFLGFNLNSVLNYTESVYVGFWGALANVSVDAGSDSHTHYNKSGESAGFTIIEWTFNTDGLAPDLLRNRDGSASLLDASHTSALDGRTILILSITIPSAAVLLLVFLMYINSLHRHNSRLSALAEKYKLRLEELELLDRGPQKFKYNELKRATKGFSSTELLGSGGFGSVYRGKLRLNGNSKQVDVAVKRISATSSQGPEEFLAEVKIIGQAQHRNLVRLLGWCHEKGELLLVYDYMPNGSVDQHLFVDKKTESSGSESGEPVLTWARRLKILSGVASALAFLHEEWEQRVIHRDVKSSNVMLDSDFNARLGDFGLAKLSDHSQGPRSTAVLKGTHGYLAPELSHTLKVTEKTDVYSFGAVVLEMATGRRPLIPFQDRRTPDDLLLVDCVWSLLADGKLLDAADSRLENAYDPREMVTLLKLGLLCSHPNPDERPNMRQFLNIWKGSTPFPLLPETKPVPVYLGPHPIGIRLDSDPMEYYSGSFSRDNSSFDGENDTRYVIPVDDYHGHSTNELGQRSGASTLALHSTNERQWKSTPLPM